MRAQKMRKTTWLQITGDNSKTMMGRWSHLHCGLVNPCSLLIVTCKLPYSLSSSMHTSSNNNVTCSAIYIITTLLVLHLKLITLCQHGCFCITYDSCNMLQCSVRCPRIKFNSGQSCVMCDNCCSIQPWTQAAYCTTQPSIPAGQ